MVAISMQTSFGFEEQQEKAAAVSGLRYMSDFIDVECESQLLINIDNQPWITELKRRVQHYGYRYDYKQKSVSAADRLDEIPGWLLTLSAKLVRDGVFEALPDQMIVNEYLPGQGIAPHIDCIPCFGETIASLSLYSPAVMHFSHSKSGQAADMLLEPRSLLILSGAARYEWKHGIAPRKSDAYSGIKIQRKRRVSITFRSVTLKT